jgi:hypothetical protein
VRIREIYAEAKGVQKKSPSSFVVLIGRALEEICREKKTPKGSLQAQLRLLVKSENIPPVFAEMSDIMREMRNLGAHEDDVKVRVTDTWRLNEFFLALIEYLYVAPYRLKQFKEALDKLKKRYPAKNAE